MNFSFPPNGSYSSPSQTGAIDASDTIDTAWHLPEWCNIRFIQQCLENPECETNSEPCSWRQPMNLPDLPGGDFGFTTNGGLHKAGDPWPTICQFALKPADALDEPPLLGDSAIVGQVFSVTLRSTASEAAYTHDHEPYKAQACSTYPVGYDASENSSTDSASSLTSSPTAERPTEAFSSTTKTTPASSPETALTSTAATSTSSPPAASPTSQTVHNGLSKTAKVGIGVGTSLGCLILLLLVITALMLRRKLRLDRERQRNAAAAARDAWQDKPELPAHLEKEEQSLSSTSIVPAEGTYRAQDVELESPDAIAVKGNRLDSGPIHELQ